MKKKVFSKKERLARMLYLIRQAQNQRADIYHVQGYGLGEEVHTDRLMSLNYIINILQNAIIIEYGEG